MLVLAASGCRSADAVRINTTVYPGGSFDRRIVFLAESSKEELHQEYILPSGGSWQVEESLVGKDKDEYRYTAFGMFQGLESDYKKRDDERPSVLSKNTIEITQTADGLCHYRETFRDTVDKTKLLEGLEQYYRSYVKLTMDLMAKTVMSEEHPGTINLITKGVTVGMLG